MLGWLFSLFILLCQSKKRVWREFSSMFNPVVSSICCLAIVASCSISAEGQSVDYHYKATLSEGTRTLRSAELNWPVLSRLMQKNQNDLQVYNAEQKAVPFTVRYMAPEQGTERQSKQLSFFTMGEIVPLDETFPSGSNYLVINSPEVVGSNKPLSLQAITLNWEALNFWLPRNLKVEVSDDLLSWQPIEIGDFPYRLSEAGVTTESRQLELKTPVSQRYIRLSDMGDLTPLLNSLKSISGSYRLVTRRSDFYCRAVSLTPTGINNQYQYDLPPSVSLRHWHFEPTNSGRLFKGVWLAREEQESPVGNKEVWGKRKRFLQYAVSADEGVIESVPVRVAFYDRTNAWRFDLDPRISGDVVPRLKVAWAPMEVVFVAEGEGPFEIRYGSNEKIERPKFDFDDLLSQGKPERVNLIGLDISSTVEEKSSSKVYRYLLSGLLIMLLLTGVFFVQKPKQRDSISV